MLRLYTALLHHALGPFSVNKQPLWLPHPHAALVSTCGWARKASGLLDSQT